MKRKATPEQIAKAKEKRAKVRELAKKIAAMSEDQRRQLVQDWPTTIEGHPLSQKNACLIVMQHPGATVLGGFRQWKTAGRFVASGPGSGLSIWIPLVRKAKDADTGEVTEDGERPGFTLGTVFDISQTREFNAAIEQDAAETGLQSLDAERARDLAVLDKAPTEDVGLNDEENAALWRERDREEAEEREPAFALANSEPF